MLQSVQCLTEMLRTFLALDTCSLVHQGAAAVHFQDFNAEVLQCLTIPNVNANLSNPKVEICYFAGDWGEVHQLLSRSNTGENCSSELDECGGYDIILMAETVYSISALPNLYQLIKKVTINICKYSIYACLFVEFDYNIYV